MLQDGVCVSDVVGYENLERSLTGYWDSERSGLVNQEWQLDVKAATYVDSIDEIGSDRFP